MRLSELNTGEKGVIVKVLGHGGFRKRIVEMGFIKGKTVEVLLNAPLRDPIKYKVMGYEISLRRQEAEMIEIISEQEAKEQAVQPDYHEGLGENMHLGEDELKQLALGKRRTINVALVGNPNCGKTTLFNLLTHKNQKVGNWPGVTIERKSGTIQNTNIELVDLPGIYSLNSYSIEEQITQSYLLHEKPDVIVNVMDATTLERSLYLTTQLLDLNLPLCIVCNKMDELKKQKMEIQFDLLQKKLNVPIFPISANQKMGITNLIQWLNCHCFKSIKTQIFPKNIEQKITCIEQELPTTISFKRWMAIKILENDRTFLTPFHLKNTSTSMMNELENHYHMDAEQILITLRYQYIEN